MKLNTNTPIPLYEQLKSIIKKDISEGNYKIGEKLPSEVKFSQIYGVSVITTRKALFELEQEGIVDRVQGKGTFVKEKKITKRITSIASFTELCNSLGAKAGAEDIEKKIIIPNKRIIESLEITDNAMVVYISRVRYADDDPVVIEKNYFNINYGYLINEDLVNKSLFKILKQKSGIEIVNSNKSIDIVRAEKDHSRFLKVNIGDPLLRISSVAYSVEDTVAYVGEQIIKAEKFTITI